jgi:YVTN family beta-propeller protein
LGYISLHNSAGETEHHSNYVALYDPVTHSFVNRIELGGYSCKIPWGVAIPPDGETVWVSCNDSGVLVVLDRYTDQILQTIGFIQSPTQIVFSLDGKYTFVGSFTNNQVSVINRKDYSIQNIQVAGPPMGLASHPFSPIIYTANKETNTISVIDTDTLSIIETIDIGKLLYWIIVSHDGQRLYTSNTATDTVSVLDAITFDQIDTITVGDYGGHISDLATSLTDDLLFVNVSRGAFEVITRVDVYNTETLELEKKVHIPNADILNSAKLNCSGNELVVVGPVGYPQSNEKHLSVIDISNLEITHQLSMPDFNQDGRFDKGSTEIALCPQLNARPRILPESIALFTNPGETVTHLITVINQSPSPISDVLSIEIFNNSLPVTLSSNVTPLLEWKESDLISLTVDLPEGARVFDELTLRVSSTYNPQNYSEIKIVTSSFLPQYLPVVYK